ncbi:MAG: hypothetical protein IJB59_14595 [Oscillospiraceae bacterium]|nr:hypothetical protein [Oscillospiraceae bacterium]
MEVHLNQGKKIAEVWLTNADQKNTQLQEYLKSMYKDYKKQGYLVAVFQSGSQDLYRQTADLLLYNRKRLAQLEVVRDKLHLCSQQ